MNEKYPLALPENTVLAGQYIIQDVLGQGGFGITYKAVDRKSGKLVAIKEYFPDSMAARVPGHSDVTTFSGERGENFVYGKQCFLQEAETLAQFIGNENIVRIYSYFEEYGTAYFVMDYIEGVSLDEYMKRRGGKLDFDEAANILIPVMDALGAVHERGIVHRDVSPDNIYITNDGVVKLIDFGAARQSLGDKSQSLDIILKHGFAPKEQYMRRGKQGPFTDIYALGATFYYALTGKRPPDSLERLDQDDLIPPSTRGVVLSKAAEEAILMALSIQPDDRFQSMGAFKNAMLAVRGVAVENPSIISATCAPASNTNPTQIPYSGNENAALKTNSSADSIIKDRRTLYIIAGIAIILVMFFVFGGKKSKTPSVPSDPGDVPQEDYGAQDIYDAIIDVWVWSSGESISIDDYGISYNITLSEGFRPSYCSISNVELFQEGNIYYFWDKTNNIALSYDPVNYPDRLSINQNWTGTWERSHDLFRDELVYK